MKENRERVLCIHRSELPDAWLHHFTAVEMSDSQFFEKISRAHMHWFERDSVETDPTFKQLIPYMVLQTRKGFDTACYRRKGTETRLHDLWSIGIGGHINKDDSSDAGMSFERIINNGMMREINEELNSMPPDIAPDFCGIINEERTSVGNVHMGLVYRLVIGDKDQIEPGPELDSFSWIKASNLSRLNLELWAQLALRLQCLSQKFPH